MTGFRLGLERLNRELALESLPRVRTAQRTIVGCRRGVPETATKGAQTANSARAGGSSMAGAALRGMASGIGSAAHAAGSAAKDKAIASPGAYAGSLLGLANAKLDQTRQSGRPTPPPPPPPVIENK